jgi:plastocyanin
VKSRRSLLTLSASALLAAAVASPTVAQSPSAPAASIPAGPAITVVGTDYHFGGLPTSVPVGTVISFENQGAELHELVAFRKNDGVTQTFEELLQLPDDEALQYVTPVDGIFASPGGSGSHAMTLTQEGEYIAICFVPQGMTELPSDPNASLDPAFAAAPPHFALGMVQAFTVTPAGTEVGPLPSAMPMDHASPEASPAA